MIDRILKTYGDVNTTVKHFPPEKIFDIFFFIFSAGRVWYTIAPPIGEIE